MSGGGPSPQASPSKPEPGVGTANLYFSGTALDVLPVLALPTLPAACNKYFLTLLSQHLACVCLPHHDLLVGRAGFCTGPYSLSLVWSLHLSLIPVPCFLTSCAAAWHPRMHPNPQRPSRQCQALF